MGFIGLYRATYDYVPQADNEIAIQEGDVLCVIQKGDDDWWKAKKKAQSDTDDEPEGLIPGNYVEEAKPVGKAVAQYEYTRQTDEELSFESGAVLDVYDTSDEDWTLAGLKGEYGFVPAIYIELEESPPPMPSRPRPAADDSPAQRAPPSPTSPEADQSPAAALAGIIQSRSNAAKAGSRPVPATPAVALPPRKQVQFTPEESEEEAPAPKLPRRPTNDAPAASRPRHVSIREPDEPAGVVQSPPHNRVVSAIYDEDKAHISGGFHLYNIFEMIEVMGKNRKTPVTLGINIAKGVISISSENSKEAKEWSADKLTHYSLEGKHVFVELVRPSKSIDFHAGAKDTAQEIVSALSELSGVAAVEGLHGFFAAGSGTQKVGKILYDFEASRDDEVSVSVGDEVSIIDDTKDNDWWYVQRMDNGKKGVVPSSYVKVSEINIGGRREPAGDSFVERNRREEERLARESSRASNAEVGPGLTLPERGSSLTQDGTARRSSQKGRRDGSKKSMPDSSRVRTWTDRSGTFKVEAEFIGLRDGKIHLHKVNGVKIAVPVTKMSPRDLEYVEKATGKSLDDDKSLADLKRSRSAKETGASVQKKPDYDWFDFFLQCGVNPQICERYAMAFRRDEMGEENMPDVTPELLRNLGIKEGDILRIMKFLDARFARTRGKKTIPLDSADWTDAGGLFSGPGGALRDNTTKKTRPTPANPAKDVVDEKAFDVKSAAPLAAAAAAAATNGRPNGSKLVDGFDDDAWAPRESKTGTPAPAPEPSPQPAAPAPAATPVAKSTIDELSGLSLSTPALLPSKTAEPAPEPVAPAPQPVKPQGATPSLFDQLAQSAANQHQNPARQRPQPPVQTSTNSLIAPPPGRAASAPQNFNQPGFNPPAPIQPQYTMHTQAAPPGQSMSELNQRYQINNMPQNNFGQYPQQTGPGFGQFPQGMQPAFQPSVQQQFINGQQVGSPFADPMVQTYPPGMMGQSMQPVQLQHTMQQLQPQHTTINAMLPPALMPQPTGPANPPFQPTFNSYGMPPVPPMPTEMPGGQGVPRPLVPQKTGPPPPVRFGVKPGEAKRLVPMPTGKRANLSQATPDNPFGF